MNEVKKCDTKYTHIAHNWLEDGIKGKRHLRTCPGHTHKHKLRMTSWWAHKITFSCIDEGCHQSVTYAKQWIRERVTGQVRERDKDCICSKVELKVYEGADGFRHGMRCPVVNVGELL